MNNKSLTSALKLPAVLLLTGQLIYIIVTQLHTGGHANDHHAIFEDYAHSGIWTAVHVGQFVGMATMIAGLFALYFALDVRDKVAKWTGRFGAIAAAATLGLYGVLQAVDGVALKQAVNAWVSAPTAEQSARFASAEAIRWLEWGVRSYQNIVLGLAFVLFAVAVTRTSWIPKAIAWLMGLSGIAYLAQGLVVGSQGFSDTESLAIVLAFVLDLAWMTWLVVVSRKKVLASNRLQPEVA